MSRMLLSALLLAAGPLLVPAPAGAQHFPPAEDLELMLRYLVEDGETPGVALGVLETDGSRDVVAYGETRDGDPVTTDTPLELGSLTMTFTGALLAEMVARGEVALEDPVAEYLPDDVRVPVREGRQITLLDLATHQSGLPGQPPEPAGELTVPELYAWLSDHELEHAPGSAHGFSVLGYGLLGHALGRAAGQSFPDLLRQRVLEPLGMTSTGYDGDAPATLAGATGLRSTARDMLAYLEANVGPPETALERAMQVAQEVREPDPEGEGWGWSWRTYTSAGQPLLVTHGGETEQSTALITFDRDRRIGTIMLASSSDFGDWAARDLLYPDRGADRARVEVDPDVLRQYTGTYRSGVGQYRATGGGRYYIRLEDEGYLTYQPSGAVRTRLYAESDSTFYMLRGPYTVAFDPRGERTQMRVIVDERETGFEGMSWRAWRTDQETPPPAVAAGNAARWRSWGSWTWALVGLVVAGGLAVILRPLRR